MTYEPMLIWIRKRYGESVSRAVNICLQMQSLSVSEFINKYGLEPKVEDLENLVDRNLRQLQHEMEDLPDYETAPRQSYERIGGNLTALSDALAELRSQRVDEDEHEDEEVESLPFKWRMQAGDGLWLGIIVASSAECMELRTLLSADIINHDVVHKWVRKSNSTQLIEMLNKIGVKTTVIPDPVAELEDFFAAMFAKRRLKDLE